MKHENADILDCALEIFEHLEEGVTVTYSGFGMTVICRDPAAFKDLTQHYGMTPFNSFGKIEGRKDKITVMLSE